MMNLFLLVYVTGVGISVSMCRYVIRNEKEAFYKIGATDEVMQRAALTLGLFSWGMVLCFVAPCIIIYRRNKKTTNHN